jgi:hypothetical protein
MCCRERSVRVVEREREKSWWGKERGIYRKEQCCVLLPKRPQRVWTASNDASDGEVDDKIVGWEMMSLEKVSVDELMNEGKVDGGSIQPAAPITHIVHSHIEIRMRGHISKASIAAEIVH